MDSEDFMTGELFNSTDGGFGEGPVVDTAGVDTVLWIVHSIAVALILVTVPFCATSNGRSMLCPKRELQRIQDQERQNQERLILQEIAEKSPQARKKQEDEIREQYMLVLMESRTMTVSSSDIMQKSDSPLNASASNEHTLCGQARKSSFCEQDVDDIESDERARKLSSMSQSDILTDPCSECDRENSEETLNGTQASVGYASSDEEDELMELDINATNEVVIVPLPGQEVGGDGEYSTRHVPNGCTICLAAFTPGDKLTWSSNTECSHVFHQDCLLNWFQAVGRRLQRKRARRRIKIGQEADSLKQLCQFPKLCPCCRQVFCHEAKDDEDEPEKANNRTSEDSSASTVQSGSADSQDGSNGNEVVSESPVDLEANF